MTIINKVSQKSVMPGITAVPDVVDAPTIGSATAGVESATVAYTAAATGGAATSFTAISTPGSITGTGSSPITVSGLTGGTAYTFKVYGTNSSGAWSNVLSAASNSVTPTKASAFESLVTTTLNSTQASVTISNIPQTYTHLQIRSKLIGTQSSPPGTCFMGISGDTDTNNYRTHVLYGDGSTAGANYLAPGGSRRICIAGHTNAGVQPTYPHAGIVDILDYTNTNKYKTLRQFFGNDTNTYGEVALDSGLWISGGAVTSLTFFLDSGSLTTGTRIAIYGIKGA